MFLNIFNTNGWRWMNCHGTNVIKSIDAPEFVSLVLIFFFLQYFLNTLYSVYFYLCKPYCTSQFESRFYDTLTKPVFLVVSIQDQFDLWLSIKVIEFCIVSVYNNTIYL